MNGRFCANFGAQVGRNPPCNSVWCGDCYTPLADDKFHINVPIDSSGFEWIKQSDVNRFKVGRNDDHLVCSFQCDECVFYMVKGRPPHKEIIKDRLLQVCIRRANLDAIWGREPSTVYKNRLTVQKAVSLAK